MVGQMPRNEDALVQQCIERLKEADAAARMQAVAQLGLLGPRALRSVAALGEMLADPLPQVRRLAAVALSEMGPEARAAVPALTRALADPMPQVRRRTVMALGEIGPDARTAVPALIDLLAGSDLDLARRAIASLGQIGPTAPASIPALVAALALEDMRCHALAVAALIRMGGRATTRLVEALGDRDPRIRTSAVHVLGKAGLPATAIPAIQRLLLDADAGVRESARAALLGAGR